MTIKTSSISGILVFIALLICSAIAVSHSVNMAIDFEKSIGQLKQQQSLTHKVVTYALLVTNNTKGEAELISTFEALEKSASTEKLEQLASELPSSIKQDFLTGLQSQNNHLSTLRSHVMQIKPGVTDQHISSAKLEASNYIESIDHMTELLREEVQATLSSLKFLINALVVVAVLFGLLFLWLMKRKLLRRLELMELISHKVISEKDLSLRVGLSTKDEVGVAASAFDDMLNAFMELIRHIYTVEHQLMEQSSMISTRAGENLRNYDLQTSELEQISTSITQMTASVEEVANRTQQASETSIDVLQSATEGSHIIDTNINVTHELASDISEASRNMDLLSHASESIGEIASTISNIAEQTNLLALNASIEAARAGDQGRGFAVVADEVRSLAHKTQEATSQIHAKIEHLGRVTDGCVHSMNASKSRSEISVEQSNNMKHAIQAIIASVETLNEINQQIAVSTDQQSLVANEISRSVHSIEGRSRETSERASNALKGAEYLQSLSSELDQTLSRYKLNDN